MGLGQWLVSSFIRSETGVSGRDSHLPPALSQLCGGGGLVGPGRGARPAGLGASAAAGLGPPGTARCRFSSAWLWPVCAVRVCRLASAPSRWSVCLSRDVTCALAHKPLFCAPV